MFRSFCAVVRLWRAATLGVYRPGSLALSTIFFDDLSVGGIRRTSVCGDINIHVDEHAPRLMQLLQCYGFLQHVAQPTDNDGHTLDLAMR